MAVSAVSGGSCLRRAGRPSYDSTLSLFIHLNSILGAGLSEFLFLFLLCLTFLGLLPLFGNALEIFFYAATEVWRNVVSLDLLRLVAELLAHLVPILVENDLALIVFREPAAERLAESG